MNKWSWTGKPSLSGNTEKHKKNILKKIKKREANPDFSFVLTVTCR
jgi:hypothetical protein